MGSRNYFVKRLAGRSCISAPRSLPTLAGGTSEWPMAAFCTRSDPVLLTGATGYVGGLLGRPHWYSLYPLHLVVFGRMLRSIAGAARH